MPRRRGRLLRRILAVVLGLVLVALVGGYWYARPLLLTGTGYAAHNACALTFIAGRDKPETDLPPNPLVPYLRTSTTRSGTDGGVAESSIFGVLAKQKAWYTTGFGCTVADEQPELGAATTIPAGANPFTAASAPTASAPVTAAVAKAFGDELSASDKQALGTRGIIVVRDGQLVAERYADGFDRTTPQLGWSMTKSVAVLLAGVLAEQGKVTATDKGLFPTWTDGRKDITVDHLMRMTSGLEWDETYDLGTPITRMLYLEPDMARYVASLPGTHAPGTFQQYSSGSTNLLCAALQDKAGAGSSADLPRKALFAPLGLSSAVLEPDADGLPVCSSYLWATPRDWAAIGQFALQNGQWKGKQLLPTDWMKQTTTVTKAEQTDDPGYAAGWRANTLPDGSLLEADLPKDAYWAAGHDGQRVVVVPSADLVVVRLGFSPGVDDIRVNALVKDLAALPPSG
jgi:CubicO group peptidase (beta-lactamase class C family)